MRESRQENNGLLTNCVKNCTINDKFGNKSAHFLYKKYINICYYLTGTELAII